MKLITIIINLIIMQAINAQELQMKIFPKGAPDEKMELTEKSSTEGGSIAGKTVIRTTDISDPEITIYPAKTNINSNAAVIVCPGGGYNILAYDLEGTEICNWLNEMGITAVLLKYRVPRREGKEKHEAPLQDAQRAIRIVRSRSEELGINPNKIGIMGFSAGAHLSVMASTAYATNSYTAVDNIDSFSSKPDFCLLVYPAYLNGEGLELSPEIDVDANTPPTMIVQTQDDKSFINSSISYYYALIQNNVSVTMHLYSTGGHGYGLRNTGHNVNEWPNRAETWFKEIGVLQD